MFNFRRKVSLLSLCSILLSIPLTTCHMEMSWPYPLRSKFNPQNNYTNIDYSMTTSLFADGSNFPCKGYQNDRPMQTTATYTAGSTYNMTLAGTVTHGGGSCQISLSYDNGATFRVIKSMIGGCPLQSTYNFTIPSCAPAAKSALLAWSWQNFEGNREFYMNCATVRIKSGRKKKQQCRVSTPFKKLPYLWKANLPGINDCTTTEHVDPVYPNPGPDVQYGDLISSSDKPTPGNCDTPTPYGQTYMDLDDSNQPAAEEQSSYPVNSRRSIITSSHSATTPLPKSPHSAVVITSTMKMMPIPTAQSPIVIDTPSAPPYVGEDSQEYLPCVPGTFICTSSTIWKTCDYNDVTETDQPWTFQYPRNVSAGMECLPRLSAYSGDTWRYDQQSRSPDGFYRSDVIVRARPDGGCVEEGSLQCSDSGQSFSICDHGGWVSMGPVASGAVCADGKIVAIS